MEDNRLNIFNRSYVIKTLKDLNANPLKKLGQNFLIDKNVSLNIEKVIPSNINLIEIGPGLGHVTRLLVPKVKVYVGIEIDKKISNFLLNLGLNIINQDFLKTSLKDFISDESVIFGNLPYYITTDIILHIIRNIDNRIKKVVLLVQDEFAKKLRDKSLITPSLVMIRHHFDVSLMFTVSKNSFYPAPSVDSRLILLDNKFINYEPEFENFLKKVFSYKRKTLSSVIKKCFDDISFDIGNERVEGIKNFYALYRELILKK